MNPPLDEPLMSRDGRTYTTKEVIELTLNPSSGLTEADQQFGTQQRQRTINSLNRMRLQHRRYVRRLQQLLSDRTKNDKHFL